MQPCPTIILILLHVFLSFIGSSYYSLICLFYEHLLTRRSFSICPPLPDPFSTLCCSEHHTQFPVAFSQWEAPARTQRWKEEKDRVLLPHSFSALMSHPDQWLGPSMMMSPAREHFQNSTAISSSQGWYWLSTTASSPVHPIPCGFPWLFKKFPL